MRRLVVRSLLPLALSFNALIGPPAYAAPQANTLTQERPVVRRRLPEGQRQRALAFVRTELFFGTAKEDGVVTDSEFRAFVDEEITPLFPDGLTVVKADGQFKGADGLTIKEDSYLLILLYPVGTQKESSRNIDAIRARYMTKHNQESVLRVDDPFLVWVSF